MIAASPMRLARRILPALPVVFYGCSDPSGVTAPRIEPRVHALAAPVITVLNTDDSGAGSLRQAVVDASAVAGSVIQFDASLAGKTIVLTSGEIDVGSQITIEGPVPAGITLSGGLTSRLFEVGPPNGDLTLRNISLVNGRQSDGGAARLRDGTKLTLDHALVANNEATVRGGAIIFGTGATVTLVNSTISGNAAAQGGGAISGDGPVTLRNSTIAFNSASGEGGGGIELSGGSLSLRNSVVANNVGVGTFTNCLMDPVPLIFTGRNISDDSSCGTDPDIVIGNPGLLPLADNGGPTRTHAIGTSSPALDSGAQCSEATDQRYVTRNQGTSCDIGAFEFNDFGTFAFTVGPNVSVNAKTGVVTVSGTIKCSKPGSADLTVTLRQTQKTTGRFTTIIQGAAATTIASCNASPSSWSAVVSPASGKFETGTATAAITTTSWPAGFLQGNASATVKVFAVK